MGSHQMDGERHSVQDGGESQRLRQACGAWLKDLREKAGLSQRELALAIGIEYYSFVSQIEAGKGRVPTSHIKAWAEAVRVPVRDFAIRLMGFYDPVNHALIFGEPAATASDTPAVSIADLQQRVGELEKLLRR